ncbi:MAG TPA: AraC family transcriptional regulator [Burkholderiaceae bacterium]
MDPLSSVIGLLRPLGTTVGATDVGGDIAIGFAAHEGAFFYSVAAGRCWLAVDGVAEPLLLRAGDCIVLPSGRPFTLASDLRLAPIPAERVFEGRPNGSIAVYNGGGRCTMFAAHFEFQADASRFLLGALPPVVAVRDAQARAALRATLDQMIDELRCAAPGCDAIVEHLAHIALVKVLRFHLSEAGGERPGWLFALADPRMGAVMAAMHADLARAWTVGELAEVGAMSRTTFATRFKSIVGVAPMAYLASLRMLTAVKRLGEPGARTSDVAIATGYQSEAAFNVAFKRVLGLPPRRYMSLHSEASAVTRGPFHQDPG